MDSLAKANVSSLSGYILAETLYRLGLREVVISPGSRSTPLTFAFARHQGIEAIPVLDERSASFFALGIAKRQHRPVALVCTSGTAAANYLPAIIEAYMSNVPLIVLTADRPPEMRDCQSGQAIDQLKIYGGYVNFFHEFATPSADVGYLNYLRQTLVHTWTLCTQTQTGPVHLNCPFRDPLAPISVGGSVQLPADFDEESFFLMVKPPVRVRRMADPFTHSENSTWEELQELLLERQDGIILCGPTQPENPEEYVDTLARLAALTGWPVLADPLCPVRHYAESFGVIVTAYDIILRNEEFADKVQPSMVLSIGPLPTSKVLRDYLNRKQIPTWIIDSHQNNVDGIHRRAIHVKLSVEELTSSLDARINQATRYANIWQAANSAVVNAVNKVVRGCDYAFEGKASWLLSRNLPEGTPIFLGNSMPIRDAEYFWQASGRKLQPFFNRGANGIDGTLSTALGIAHHGQPAVLLTGDLALLHDMNGFMNLPYFKGSLTIIVINNNGGGIFEALPIKNFEPEFENYFATPQSVNFKRLAKLYGIDYGEVMDLDKLLPVIKKLPAKGVRLIEVLTDRKRDMVLRKQLFADVAAKLS